MNLPKPPARPLKTPSRSMIWLLRHGVIQAAEAGKRYIGRQDLPLSDIGLGQARAWADYFAGLKVDKIVSSPLIRCLETARIIGGGCRIEPQVIAQLVEICLGSWEGRRFETIKTLFPQAFRERGEHMADHRPPGGESFRDVQQRVWPLFETLTRQLPGNTLIVTHAGVIRVLLCSVLGMPLDHLFRMGQDHGALNIIEIRSDGFRLQSLNQQAPH